MVWKNKFWSGKSQGILFLTKGGHPVKAVWVFNDYALTIFATGWTMTLNGPSEEDV